MKRYLAAALWLHCALAAPPDGLEPILQELSRISGLKVRGRIDSHRIGKAQLKQFIERRMKEEIKPEDLRAEELTLKKFGFLPPEFDLKSTTVELLAEQAAALYDYRQRKMFLLEGWPPELERSALVHELAHALADQNFNLEKYIQRAGKSDDASLARMAVMEGQATWLMAEYTARQGGLSLESSKFMVEMMARAGNLGSGQFPVLEKAPMYLREILMFPYTHGFLFQHRVYERSGKKAFAEVFLRPPVSTQQILHPELYFEGRQPAVPATPQPPGGRAWRELNAGMIGEFDHGILLRQYVSDQEARALAPLGRGGSYRLLEHKQGGRLVLCYASQWEDAAAAGRFFAHYRTVLGKKWKKLEVWSQSEGKLVGRGDDGFFALTLRGDVVSALEGLESAGEHAALK